MNILVIIQGKFAGCGFYRLYQPHNHLAKNYDVKITFGSGFMRTEVSAYTDEELREFDLIVWHKTLFKPEDIKRAKSLGVPTVIDFDDHWVVNREHTLYREYQKEGLVSKLHKALLLADYVTCTTESLADEIYKVNENVEVLPNAFDKGYSGWKNERVKEDKYVFGYLGGPCHTRDVALLRGVNQGFNFRLFGYNGTNIYKFYNNILKGERFKGADIWNYPRFYNYMDCSLVPLEANNFNRFKSELKLIEAGAFKKAVIVSGVEPYTLVAKHESNCLVAHGKAQWVDSCKRLVENPQLGIDLGEQLAEDVKEYDIKEVNKKRFNFYKDVQQKHNTNSSPEFSRVEFVN